MGEKDNCFYVKFIIDIEKDQAMGVASSPDLEKIKEWSGETEEDEDQNADENLVLRPSSFKEMSVFIKKTIGSIMYSLPLLMMALPIFSSLRMNGNIRKFSQRHGEKMEEGKYEIYKLPNDCGGEFAKIIEEYEASAIGARALPPMFLMGLVSAYDEFFSNLIRIIYLKNPKLVTDSEKNISFQDLVEVGSVELMREKIIEREIDSIMRKNHNDQVEWIEKKLSLSKLTNNSIWPKLVEIFERRNLMTHAGGIVNRQYLENCRKNNIDVSKLSVGDSIGVDSEYFSRASEDILEYAFKLTQIVWRKMDDPGDADASRDINDFGFWLIKNKKYRLASSILEFASEPYITVISERTRKMIIVNRANSELLQGNEKQSKKILDKEDWTAVSDEFKICVAAVRKEYDNFLSLAKKILETEPDYIANIRNWPVFIILRENSEFVERFEKETGYTMVGQWENVGKKESEQSEDKNITTNEGKLDEKTIH